MTFPSSLVQACCPRDVGARKRGPVTRGSFGRAQLIPAKPIKLWGARSPPVLPMQVGELQVAVDQVAVDGL
eukprot:3751841-Prorocentrum_lima.AAC.1